MGAVRIGLTGGIGSGKSTVAALWAELGAVIIDTDAIAHSLTAPDGKAIAPITAEFGAAMIDARGALDRARMRELVFADPSARARLEAIIHPLIRVETERQAAAAPPGAVRLFDVPLLVESGKWRERVDHVLVVDCDEATQIERVVARNGWAPEAVQRVIAQQASREQRRAVADAVVVNQSKTIDELRAEVAALWLRWVGGAPPPAPL
ncbi:MAG: dephospho-CoA kinase [Burkholderiales bacterium]|nr:dephospho-CoA kinase [Burkholderiales bacterium]